MIKAYQDTKFQQKKKHQIVGTVLVILKHIVQHMNQKKMEHIIVMLKIVKIKYLVHQLK